MCLYVHVSAGALTGQQRAMDPLELEAQEVVSCMVRVDPRFAVNQTQILFKRAAVLLTAVLSLQSHHNIHLTVNIRREEKLNISYLNQEAANCTRQPNPTTIWSYK